MTKYIFTPSVCFTRTLISIPSLIEICITKLHSKPLGCWEKNLHILTIKISFGLLGFRTIGPSDYWTFGLLGLRTIGPSDYWADTETSRSSWCFQNNSKRQLFFIVTSYGVRILSRITFVPESFRSYIFFTLNYFELAGNLVILRVNVDGHSVL